MNIAVLIILVIVGGIILWGALTGWTFSGIFGGAKRDSPPGPITNVQIEASTGESGGRRESYTTTDEMAGLSITISFDTPNSFGYGDLALKDYVISLGTAKQRSQDNYVRGDDLLAVILISREDGNARLITKNKDISAPGGIALSGDFNARAARVSITLSSPLWKSGEIVIREGKVFLGIEYTPMEMTADPTWPGEQQFDKPAGDYTRYFINGGVTLIGEVEDDAGFVVDPDVTDSVNEQLDIAVQADGAMEEQGEVDIRKQIPKSSRFLISPAHRQDIFLGFPPGGIQIKAAIKGQSYDSEPNPLLNTFRKLPDATTDNISGEINLTHSLSTVSEAEFWDPDNWFNFVILEEHSSGWVRLGLISNFEFAPLTVNDGRIVRRVQFPAIHPVHQRKSHHTQLIYHYYNEALEAANEGRNNATDPKYFKTYFKFVSPLDRGVDGKRFSLCMRRVNRNNIDNSLSADLSTSDLFLVLKNTSDGVRALLEPLHDIVDPSMGVFTKRSPFTYTPDDAGKDRMGSDLGTNLDLVTTGGSLGDCKKRCSSRNDCAGFSYRASDGWCAPKGFSVKDSGLVDNDDFTYYRKQTTFRMPADLTNTDGDAAMTRSFWGGAAPGSELDAVTVEECEQRANDMGAPAYTVRTEDHGMQNYKNTCYAYTTNWTATPKGHQDGLNSHYTVCIDRNKKVKNSCKS